MNVGQPVAPDTEIGEDHCTGRPVLAGCHGRVSMIAFSGGEHALMVVVTPD